MAYGARKRITRRKAYRAKRKATKNTIQKIVNRTLRSNLEVKVYKQEGVESAVSTLTQGNNWFYPFAAIPQGLDSYHRTGNKIKGTGVGMKMYFNNNSTAAIWVRVALFRLADQGAISSTTPIFSSASSAQSSFAATTGLYTMFRQFHPSAVLKTYYNKVFKLSANSGEGAAAFKRVNKFVKFGRGMNLQFNQNNVGSTNVDKNIIFGVWASRADEDVGAGDTIEFSYQVAGYYTDA